ncbi:MAG: polymer-forming cytoskeletal protein [Sutterellaceae bacterium]|nr:polymer-forming cytoskeletal protein [Burkholderiaceae bacterium]MDW8430771.1 polymer-forming cytoskeletal protein [Sutterellaceae bacterium]
MFGRKSRAQKEIASLIGIGTTVIGDIAFTGGLRVDGTVRGAVRCVDGEKGGMLVISEHGVVEGEVRAAHLVVAGRIEGPVYTTELIELQPKARVIGDVYYQALEMHNGAVVDGKLVHAPGEAAARPGLKLAAPAPPREPMKTEAKAG